MKQCVLRTPGRVNKNQDLKVPQAIEIYQQRASVYLLDDGFRCKITYLLDAILQLKSIDTDEMDTLPTNG